MSDYYASDDGIADPSDATVAGEWSISMMDGAFRDQKAVTLGYAPNPFRTYEPAVVPYDDLRRHMAVTGATGYGKSTFIQNGLRQVAANGHGFCYISSGDDIRRVAERLPDERTGDIYYVGELDGDYYGFNVLGGTQSERERELLSERLIDELQNRRRSNLSGEEEEAVSHLLRGAMAADEEYTIQDLVDKLETSDDVSTLESAFEADLSLLQQDQRSRDTAQRQLEKYVQSDSSRQLIADASRDRSLAEAVRDGAIILVERPAVNRLLQKVVAGFALARVYAAKAGGEEEAFFVLAADDIKRYSDETDFENLLATARRFNLSVWLSAQDVSQLYEERRRAVYANCGTIASFNAGSMNGANNLSTVFGDDVSRNDLMELNRFEALTRLCSDEVVTVYSFPQYPVQRENVESLLRE